MPAKPLQQVQVQQIERSIPPLSQSRQGDMACDHLYHARHIQGVKYDSEPARRGKLIHDIISEYVKHLMATKQRSDLPFFEGLCAASTMNAQEVLDTFGDTFVFNPESVVGTEMYIAVDTEWNAFTDLNREESESVAFEGTLDLITMESDTEATIHDWKSYFRIIDADTFQSKMYPLLLFCLNPSLRKVRFVLDFVRYGDAHREVVYTHEDVPKLKQLAQRERARQINLYSQTALQTTPGRHCTWCPKLSLGCPIQGVNPYSEMTGPERVAFAVWLKEATKHNTEVLKDLMLEGGPITYRDANQVGYVAEFRRQERKSYALGKSLPILNGHFETHPGDRELLDKLTVSGLSSPLKAKKRAELAKGMAGVASINVITKFSVGHSDDEDEENDAY